MTSPAAPSPPSFLAGWVTRLTRSAVIWSWMYNGFRFASGLILLPLLVHPGFLSRADLGMYYLFIGLAAIVPMADFGFALSVERNLSYALGGAGTLQADGMARPGDSSGGSNRSLVLEIVAATHRLYAWLALGAVVLLIVGGSVLVGLRISETTSPGWTWLAWAVQIAVAGLELYTAYWVAVLRGLNRVTSSARWLSLAYGLKLAASALLLVAGTGLMAVPVAGLLSGIVLRWGAGREVRGLLGPRIPLPPGALRRLLAVMWPNSWRLGIQYVALYVGATACSFVYVQRFSLEEYQPYGLSLQIMKIAIGIAAVWTSVKWPVIAQLRLSHDLAAMRGILRPRFGLQLLTYAALGASAVALGQPILEWLGSDRQVLPRILFALLMLNGLGDLNFQFWTTLISTENRIPAVWSLVITQTLSALVSVALVVGLGRGLDSFIVPPLVLGCLFNFWWWAIDGARGLGTTLTRFLLEPSSALHAKGNLRTS